MSRYHPVLVSTPRDLVDNALMEQIPIQQGELQTPRLLSLLKG